MSSNNRWFNLLIIAALVFGPYSQLRIARIGLSELVIIILVASVLVKKDILLNLYKKDYFIFTRFWAIFLFISFLGLGYNIIFLRFSSGIPNLVIIDTVAYLLAALACFTFELLIYCKKVDIKIILNRVFIFSSSILLVLFIISRFTNSLFGYTLLQYANFRPLATNVHHPAMLMVPLPFLGLKYFYESSNRYHKALALILVLSNIIISFFMASTKLLMGLVIGTLVLVYFYIINNIMMRNRTLLVVITLLLFASALILINPLRDLALAFFESEDVGGARASLWLSSINKIMSSPIFGFGPGPHALLYGDTFDDAHQSLLTVGLQGGIVALIAYSYLLMKVLVYISRKPIALASFMGILIYALGGDILRQTPMWIYIMLLYYFVLDSTRNILTIEIAKSLSDFVNQHN